MDRPYYPVPIRVRYAETDQMGVVHHSVYPVWFEVARSELSRSSSLAYSAWEESGVLLMVTGLHCRYRRSARYDQEVTVWVRVSEIASRQVVFEYRVTAPSGELLVEGVTRHLVVNRGTHRPMAIPERCRKALLEPPPGERSQGDRPGEE